MALIEVTVDNFEQEVLNSDVPVLVDFFATWCGPCKLVMGHLSALTDERSDVKVVKVDVDKAPTLAQQYNVMAIPTLLLFQNGVAAEIRLSGASDKGKIGAYVDGLLSP